MTYAPFDLTGKTALVTGGNRGIGYGMAEALAASNAHVAIWGRNAKSNEEAAEKLSGLGAGDVKAWSVDVTNEQAVVTAMEETNAWKGRLDSVIANAGVGFGAKSFHEMSTEIYRRNMAVNLDGAFWTLREASKHMVERAKNGDPGGSLVGIASLAAISGASKSQAYAATKGGLISMLKAIATEYGRYGIRANAILPGWIATDLTEGAQGNDIFESKVMSRVPAHRWGQPADFGGIAVYLTSDASSYHSGDTLVVDGAYAIF